MLTVLRHALAILILPFTVVVVVPAWLRQAFGPLDPGWAPGAPLAWPARLAGAVLLGTGFFLFAWCVSLFMRVGQGTLAPWDPTRRLVAVGPYRHVRNPMIVGVVAMLAGQALLWGSWAVALWAAFVAVLNHGYFVLSEEPGLESRFGEAYLTYKANVPRWLPRPRPWLGP